MKKKINRRSHKKRSSTKTQSWRQSSNWHKARKLCLELHKNTCYISGELCHPSELDIHHIKDASSYPKLRYKQSNLIPAKRKLHKFYHVYFLGGFKKPTGKISLFAFKVVVKSLIKTKRVITKAQIKGLILLIIGLLTLVYSELNSDDIEIVDMLSTIISQLYNII